MFVKLANGLVGFIGGGIAGMAIGAILALLLFIIIFIPIQLFAGELIIADQYLSLFCLYGLRIGYILGAIVGTYLILKKDEKNDTTNY